MLPRLTPTEYVVWGVVGGIVVAIIVLELWVVSLILSTPAL